MNTQEAQDKAYELACEERDKLQARHLIIPPGPERKARIEYLKTVFQEN